MDLNHLVMQSGAIEKGLFKLASGKYSDIYIQKFRILEQPKLLKRLCKEIVNHFNKPDIIIGPSTGGILVAYEIATQFEINALYIETESGKKVNKRGGYIPEHSRVLVVDDVLTTGISLKETIEVIKIFNIEIIGVSTLIDRSQDCVEFGCDFYSPCKFDFKIYNEIPDCLKGIPVTIPGMRIKE